MITQDVSQTLTDSIACVGLSLSLVSRFLWNEVGALTFEAKCIVKAAVEIILGLDGALLRHLVIVVQLLLLVLHVLAAHATLVVVSKLVSGSAAILASSLILLAKVHLLVGLLVVLDDT